MEKELMKEEMGSLLDLMKQEFQLGEIPPQQFSPLTLAYIGDCIYDLIIRTIVVMNGNAPVNKLHREVSGLVKAQAQAELFHTIETYLTAEEHAVYKRGRNAKSFTSAKNASIVDYRIATGMEALIGYLYLNNQMSRAIEILRLGLEEQRHEKQVEK